MMTMKQSKLWMALLVAISALLQGTAVTGFVVVTPTTTTARTTASPSLLQAAAPTGKENSIIQSPRSSPTSPEQLLSSVPKQVWTAVSAMVLINLPIFMATAAEVIEDDYEYGKVDAPIGIAVAGGLLAILTAAVPVLLRPGEEALEEMRENEGYSFGKDDKGVLNRRKK